jgi:hypothetical protein
MVSINGWTRSPLRSPRASGPPDPGAGKEVVHVSRTEVAVVPPGQGGHGCTPRFRSNAPAVESEQWRTGGDHRASVRRRRDHGPGPAHPRGRALVRARGRDRVSLGRQRGDPRSRWLHHQPLGQMHAMWNASGRPGRVVEVITPGGFETCFREPGEVIVCTRVRLPARGAGPSTSCPNSPNWPASTGSRTGRRTGWTTWCKDTG